MSNILFNGYNINSAFQRNDIFNVNVEGKEEIRKNEKSEMSILQNMPTDLYVPMISTLPSSMSIEKLGRNTYRKDTQDTLRNWIQIARTSKGMFDLVMQEFHNHPIFTSLVSSVETERRGSYSLLKSLRPTVDFVKAMARLEIGRLPFDNNNPFLNEPVKSFFDVFWRVNWIARDVEKKLNIVASTPRFLFEVCEKRRLPQSTVFVCREEYGKRDKDRDLPKCIDALEKLTIDGPVDETQFLRAIRYNTKNFFNLLPSLQSEQKYILAAADDDEVVTAALWRNGTLKFDRNFVLEIVRKNGQRLAWFPHFKNDNEIVLAAVQQSGNMLQHVSEALQNNPTIVLAAVQQNGNALWYASEALQNNPKIVLAAVQQNGNALWYASEAFQNDPKIVLAAVQQDGRALKYASEELKKDPEIVLAAVQQNGRALKYASEELKNNPIIILAAVRQNGLALRYADASLTKDITIAFDAVQNNRYAIRYVHDGIKEHPKITALKTSPGRRVWEVLE